MEQRFVGALIVDLQEGRGFGRLARRCRIAGARDDRQCRIFHRDIERRQHDAGVTGDLVERAQLQNRLCSRGAHCVGGREVDVHGDAGSALPGGGRYCCAQCCRGK